jgi:hypothetical protein
MKRFAKWKVDGMISDYPARLAEVIGDEGLTELATKTRNHRSRK